MYFDRETYGDRTFDFNTDGVATYGLWIDWIEALRVAGQEAEAARAVPQRRGLPADVGSRQEAPGLT